MNCRIFNLCIWSFCIYTHGGPQFQVSSKGLVWSLHGIWLRRNLRMGAKQTIGVNGHPSVWQLCLVVLNLGFWERALSLCSTDSLCSQQGLIYMKRLPPWDDSIHAVVLCHFLHVLPDSGATVLHTGFMLDTSECFKVMHKAICTIIVICTTDWTKTVIHCVPPPPLKEKELYDYLV